MVLLGNGVMVSTRDFDSGSLGSIPSSPATYRNIGLKLLLKQFIINL